MDITRCPKCQSYNLTVNDSRIKDGMRYRSRKCLDCGTISKAVEISREEYAKLQAVRHLFEMNKDGWIPISNMPDYGVGVMLQDHFDNYELGERQMKDGVDGFTDENGEWWTSANNYVAWRPLPKPYRPKKEEANQCRECAETADTSIHKETREKLSGTEADAPQ